MINKFDAVTTILKIVTETHTSICKDQIERGILH